MLPADPIKWALDRFRTDGLTARYAKYLDYADGVQDSRLSQPHFDRAFGKLYEALTYNRCKAVVDTIADRVHLTGFQVVGGGTLPTEFEAAWDENRMDKREGEVNQEALTTGDGYVIVWPDQDTGQPVLWPQDAANVRIRYDDERPGTVELAAKLWRTSDDFLRLNLYLPERLEKYVSRAKHKGSVPASPAAFEPYRPDGDLAWPLPYAWFDERRPSVPVVHFANNARTGRYGRSELKDVIPLQDGLNYAMALLMSTAEQEGYKQKWGTGLAKSFAESGVDVGRDRLLGATDPGARFGNFDAGDLAALIQVNDQFDVQIARVSKIPVHYLSLSGDFPSGESLRTADTPLVRKAEDIHAAFGNDWEDVADLMMRMQGVADPPRVEAQYRSAEPQNEKDEAERAYLLKQAGFPLPSMLREIGKTDEEIEQILLDRDAEVDAARRAFDAGEVDLGTQDGTEE